MYYKLQDLPKTPVKLYFTWRNKLKRLYEDFCKENSLKIDSPLNVITWLDIKGLLDFEKVNKFLEGGIK